MLTEERWKILFWTCFCLASERAFTGAVQLAEEVQPRDFNQIDHLDQNGYSDSPDRHAREGKELYSGENLHSHNGEARREISPSKNRFLSSKASNESKEMNLTSNSNRKQNLGFVMAIRKRREAYRAIKTDSEPYFLNDEGSDFVPYEVIEEAQKHTDKTLSRIHDFDGLSDTKIRKRNKSLRQAVAFIVTPESFASLLKSGINKNSFSHSKKLNNYLFAEKQPQNKQVSFRNSSQNAKKRIQISDDPNEWDYIFSDIIPKHNENSGNNDDFSPDAGDHGSIDDVEKFKRREYFSSKSAPLFREEKSDKFKKRFSIGFDSILFNAKPKLDKVNGKAKHSSQSNLKKPFSSVGLRTEGETDTFFNEVTKSLDPILSTPKGEKFSPFMKSPKWDHPKNKVIDKLAKDVRVNKIGSKYESAEIFDVIESSKRFEDFDKMKKRKFNSEFLKENRVSPFNLTRKDDSDELLDLLTLLDFPANFKKDKKVNANLHGNGRSSLQPDKSLNNAKIHKISKLNLKNENAGEAGNYSFKNVNRDHDNKKIKINHKIENKKGDNIRKEINYFSEDEPTIEQSTKENYFKNENSKSRLRDKSETKMQDGCDRKSIRCINLNNSDSSNSSYPEKYKSVVEILNRSPNLISKFDFQLLNSPSSLKHHNKPDEHRKNEKKPDIKLFENLLQLHELTRVKIKNETEKVPFTKETLLKHTSSNALREKKEKGKTISKDRSNKSAITLAELINSFSDKGADKNGANVTFKIPSRIEYSNITSFASSTIRPKSFQDVTEEMKSISKYFSIAPTKLPSFSKVESKNNFRAEPTHFSLPASKSIFSDTLPAVPLSISSLTPGGSPVFINSHVFVSSTPFPELLSQLDYIPRIRTPSSLSPNENLQSPGVHYHILPGLFKGNHALRGLLEGDPLSNSLLSGLNTVSNKGLIGIHDPLQRLRNGNSFNSSVVTTPPSFTHQTSAAFLSSSPFPSIPYPTTSYPTTSFPTSSFPTTLYPTPLSSVHKLTSPVSTFSDNNYSPIPTLAQRALSTATLSPIVSSPTKLINTAHQPTTPFATSLHPSTPFPNISRSPTPFPAVISHVTSPFPTQQQFPVTPFPSLRHSSNLLLNTPHPVTTLIPFTTLYNSQSIFPHSATLSSEHASDSSFSNPQNSLIDVAKNPSRLNISPKIQLSVTSFSEVSNLSPLLRSKVSFSTPSFSTKLPKQLTAAPLTPSIQAQRQPPNSRRLRARIISKERTPTLAPLINSDIQAQISIKPFIVNRPGYFKKTRKKVRRKGKKSLLGSQNSTEIASQVSLAISPIPKIVSAFQDTLVSNTGSGNIQNSVGSVTKRIELHNNNLANELNKLNKITSTDSNTKKFRKRRPSSKLHGKAEKHASTTAVPIIDTPSSFMNSFQSTLQDTAARKSGEHISLVSSTSKSTFSKPNSLTKINFTHINEPAIKKISSVPRVKNPTPPSSHQVLSNFTSDNRKLKPLHSQTSITPVSKRKNQSAGHYLGNSHPLRLVLSNSNDAYPLNFPIVHKGFMLEEGVGYPVSAHNLAVSNGLTIIPRNSLESSFIFNPNEMLGNSISSVRNVGLHGQMGIPYFENALPDLPRHQARTNAPIIEQGSYFTPSVDSFDLIAEKYPVPVDFHGRPTIVPLSRSVDFGSPFITRGPPPLRKYYLQDV